MGFVTVAVLTLGWVTACLALKDSGVPFRLSTSSQSQTPQSCENTNVTAFDPEKDPWIETVSMIPRAFVYHNFLSDEECAHIKQTAAPQMRRSTVVGDGGKGVVHGIRTSSGTFLRRMQDEIIERIEQRLVDWTHLPLSHQEDMQVLRYGKTQTYGAHSDVLDEGSPRVATVLMYLNDVEGGGETAFPETSEWISPELEQRLGPFSECVPPGKVAFRPRRRDALLFYSLHPNNTLDQASMHTGCPVTKGVKWTAVKWIHVSPFNIETFHKPREAELPKDPGLCKDYDSNCEDWAAAGECENNTEFMLGAMEGAGACRLACGACKACEEDDVACYNVNRDSGGYLVVEEHELQ